ncbi:hypothetical protein KDW_06460 [Dictyobacter vulcani]|uniref:Zinc-ribbon domain-containing protein n=1 Tax=Dictyobacter vulcani TaxID=2607529 RepID=A0A5J4KCC8_9CHLR|nr:zinc ribbon domain-containing protein [Dictyobacter vulcani]GER86484.1 hypothetical protein KDW_06460 [Dictyobacter vulcani]
MFCAFCGSQVKDGDRFCKDCGASLQGPGNAFQSPVSAVQSVSGNSRSPRRSGAGAGKNPYRDQIAHLRLELKEARIHLKEVNNQISGTRSNYFELDSFVQRGIARRVGRMIEGAQLFGPYQRRKQLQDQIRQLEMELLQLERAQEQWRLQKQ